MCMRYHGARILGDVILEINICDPFVVLDFQIWNNYINIRII